jgi:AcrR family transcriptional regulator
MSEAATDTKAQTGEPKARIVDALLRLAAESRFESIAIRDICREAGVTLADFRDAFPSKGAALGALSKRLDHVVLSHDPESNPDEGPRERLFEVLMRRLDAMAPYRDGLREIVAWLRRDPSAALAMNQVATNSMRFMLEAAGVDYEGAAGAIKLQGLVFAWMRVIDVWLADEGADLAKTMAELDRVLTRGERAVANLERIDQFAAPIKAIARAAFEARGKLREAGRRRARPSSEDEGDSAVAL